jgi:hypothetical protein
MKPILINITQKGFDKFIIGCWCINGLLFFKIRETNREHALEEKIYKKYETEMP